METEEKKVPDNEPSESEALTRTRESLPDD